MLLDGRPVEHYGVIVSASYVMWIQTNPVEIRSRDGRFILDGLSSGSRDIIVVAPQLGVRYVLGKEIVEGSVLNLGDLALRRGPTISGRVTDLDGRPIANASVRIVTSSHEVADELTEISRGNFSARTGRDGRYRIEGATLYELAHFSSRMFATSGTSLVSEAVFAPTTSSTIDFVLQPAGTIDGVVGPLVLRGETVMAIPRGNGTLRYADVGEDRRFHFDTLVPGVYDLQLVAGWNERPTVVSVVVEAGKHTTVSLVYAK